MKLHLFGAAVAAMIIGAPLGASAAPIAPAPAAPAVEDGLLQKVVGPVWIDEYGRQCEVSSSGTTVCRRRYGGGGWGGDGYYRRREREYYGRDYYGGGGKFFVDRYGRRCERASSGYVNCH